MDFGDQLFDTAQKMRHQNVDLSLSPACSVRRIFSCCQNKHQQKLVEFLIFWVLNGGGFPRKQLENKMMYEWCPPSTALCFFIIQHLGRRFYMELGYARTIISVCFIFYIPSFTVRIILSQEPSVGLLINLLLCSYVVQSNVVVALGAPMNIAHSEWNKLWWIDRLGYRSKEQRSRYFLYNNKRWTKNWLVRYLKEPETEGTDRMHWPSLVGFYDDTFMFFILGTSHFNSKNPFHGNILRLRQNCNCLLGFPM